VVKVVVSAVVVVVVMVAVVVVAGGGGGGGANRYCCYCSAACCHTHFSHPYLEVCELLRSRNVSEVRCTSHPCASSALSTI
jgi:hypothetical protein